MSTWQIELKRRARAYFTFALTSVTFRFAASMTRFEATFKELWIGLARQPLDDARSLGQACAFAGHPE
jgi:hypothetical protein